ncbi:histidine-rich protein PFHRP-II-like [Anopheles darlingi]|uniref:histidine-rich protein PFHRP-II-like n=1 Tax=Anopheles darlingi TaxID=43151 RepID=UPI0020FFF8E1|nr:histidine-rich protein PFHRP-II-like [Anopheles darlingi]
MNAAMIVLLCITSVCAYSTGHVGGTGHTEKVSHEAHSYAAATTPEAPKYQPTHHGGYEKHTATHVGKDSHHRSEAHHNDLHSSKSLHQQQPKDTPHGYATTHHGPTKETASSHHKTGYGY